MSRTGRKAARCAHLLWIAPVSALFLTAGEPLWNAKPIDGWTEDDVRQILTDSPWSKSTKANVTRIQTEDQRRESGYMGQQHGVGYDGLETPPRPKLLSIPAMIIGIGPAKVPEQQSIQLLLRWETAAPVRVAELKSPLFDPPALPGDGYSLAIYGVPLAKVKNDPIALGNPLKKQTFLRRAGKKDVKPSRAAVFEREDGMVVVYTFPLSAEITAKDGQIEILAEIGRLVFDQSFDLAEMVFQGRLEL